MVSKMVLKSEVHHWSFVDFVVNVHKKNLKLHASRLPPAMISGKGIFSTN